MLRGPAARFAPGCGVFRCPARGSFPAAPGRPSRFPGAFLLSIPPGTVLQTSPEAPGAPADRKTAASDHYENRSLPAGPAPLPGPSGQSPPAGGFPPIRSPGPGASSRPARRVPRQQLPAGLSSAARRPAFPEAAGTAAGRRRYRTTAPWRPPAAAAAAPPDVPVPPAVPR